MFFIEGELMAKKSGYSHVINLLRQELEQILLQLQQNATQADIIKKNELKNAIVILEYCHTNEISGNIKVTVIPEAPVQTPSPEFRLMFDNETDKRELWSEVLVNGKPVRPQQGALILEID
jgi:hypothetical protein